MNTENELETACWMCGVHITFGRDRLGEKIKCPQCLTELVLPESSPKANAAPPSPTREPKLAEPKLIPCPDCNHMLSRHAQVCPSCGFVVHAEDRWSLKGKVLHCTFYGMLTMALIGFVLWLISFVFQIINQPN